MPIYEYECTSCYNVFEIFQHMTEDPLTACPDCAGSVKKLMSMSSFQLKGGGWYADGYSSTPCKKPGSSTTEVSSESSPEKAKKATKEKAEKVPSSKTDSSATTQSKKSCPATT